MLPNTSMYPFTNTRHVGVLLTNTRHVDVPLWCVFICMIKPILQHLLGMKIEDDNAAGSSNTTAGEGRGSGGGGSGGEDEGCLMEGGETRPWTMVVELGPPPATPGRGGGGRGGKHGANGANGSTEMFEVDHSVRGAEGQLCLYFQSKVNN